MSTKLPVKSRESGLKKEVVALKRQNLKLQNKIVSLEAQCLTDKNRITALEKYFKKHGDGPPDVAAAIKEARERVAKLKNS